MMMTMNVGTKNGGFLSWKPCFPSRRFIVTAVVSLLLFMSPFQIYIDGRLFHKVDFPRITLLSSQLSRYSINQSTCGCRSVQTLKQLDHINISQNVVDYFFKDYIQFHTSQRYNASSRVLIFIPYRTGIGDSFRTLIFAYWTAVISQRVLLIHWTKPFPLSIFMQNINQKTDFFNSITNTSVLNDNQTFWIKSSKHYRFDFQRVVESKHIQHVVLHPHTPPNLPLLHSFIKNNIPWNISKPSEIALLIQDRDFQRRFFRVILRISDYIRIVHEQESIRLGIQRFNYLKNYGLKHKLLLNFPSFSQNQDKQLQLQYHHPLKQKHQIRPYIAVHARMGKGVGETKHPRFVSYIKNPTRLANCLAWTAYQLTEDMIFTTSTTKTTAFTPIAVFVATDTVEFRKIFKNQIDALSNGRVTVINGNWNITHNYWLGLSRFKENDTLRVERLRREKQVLISTYLDLLFLAGAKHMVGTASRFSDLGYVLGDAYSLTSVNLKNCTNQEYLY